MTTLKLYAHPFSSYCGKVLTALYENDTPFAYRTLNDAESGAELASLWPMKRFPILIDDGRMIAESTIIIEHLDLFHPGATRFLPADAKAALETRFMDRFFDEYVMTPMQKIVFNHIREEKDRDAFGANEAHEMLERAYSWLNGTLASRTWAAGETFSLADCSAALSLFFSDWVHPIDPSLSVLKDFRARLLARPSIARVVEEARPYRHFFPPGAPDRD
ncbi:glutathione S-transferase family protein [Pararhizobium sp.]|uniref:glutathione S-transferase family protein n=1 Tax=Pararhizobium sp. TaxID=1977563 RepID=UPI002723D6A5|nr:glutathione S-transferase family protein [Pararhizobium sp.]MDO9416885.1 glutathione S-transferase family protein [Pararhizobium sp.]